jgi:hypothetical protein
VFNRNRPTKAMSLPRNLNTSNNQPSLSRGRFISRTMNTRITRQKDFTAGMNGVAMNTVTNTGIRHSVPKHTVTVYRNGVTTDSSAYKPKCPT